MTAVSMVKTLSKHPQYTRLVPSEESAISKSTETMEGPSTLTRIASGEESAFHDCVEKYGNLVWSIARRFSATPSDAEDAVQEIFLEIWRKSGKWDPSKSSEATFITMIARRRLIDQFRKSSRSLEVSCLGTDVEIPARSDTNRAEILDESEKANHCLDKLGERQREVLRQSIQLGQSHQRIAEMLGLPLGTVKTFARRSLIQLRDCMEQNRFRGAAS